MTTVSTPQTVQETGRRRPMSGGKALLLGGLLSLAVVHGGFWIKYGTVHPCQAAVERVSGLMMPKMMARMDQQLEGNMFARVAKAMIVPLMSAMKQSVARELAQRDIVKCYAIALGQMDGELTNVLDQALTRP